MAGEKAWRLFYDNRSIGLVDLKTLLNIDFL